MKRTVTGFALLILLLLGGLPADRSLSRQNALLAARLEDAAGLAVAGDLQEAVQTAREAEEVWLRRWTANAALTNHTPMETVDCGFAQLKIYAESGEAIAFASLCSQMASQIQAVSDAYEVSLRNIL